MLNSYLWPLMEIINYMTLQNIFLATVMLHEEKLMNPMQRDIMILFNSLSQCTFSYRQIHISGALLNQVIINNSGNFTLNLLRYFWATGIRKRHFFSLYLFLLHGFRGAISYFITRIAIDFLLACMWSSFYHQWES